MSTEEERRKNREKMRARRAKLKEAGIKPPPLTPEQRARAAARQMVRRERARAAGITLPGDDWAARNPERHRNNVQRWRDQNGDYKRALDRDHQADRRSTPWGRINNNMVAIMHYGVRKAVSRPSKYTQPLGYTWADLRAHLEAQFSPEMNWDNWGDVWEVDHVKPLSSFKYESLEDRRFLECWALSNLRPLGRFENNSKGAKAA